MFFVFPLHIELANAFRELLELLIAHPSISVLIKIVHNRIDVILWWRWTIHHLKQLANREIHLFMAQISASISIEFIKHFFSVFLQIMFGNMTSNRPISSTETSLSSISTRASKSTSRSTKSTSWSSKSTSRSSKSTSRSSKSTSSTRSSKSWFLLLITSTLLLISSTL